jgi:aspartyl-tRNA(Asn)/glutamyl-tRNA(Gln) amidotransferase subunit B
MSSTTEISAADRQAVTDADVTTIIGLEVHVQLKTESKLFCGCSTQFGQEPNTQTCPVCTGMPGSLPVLNKEALKLSIKTGLALNCEIAKHTKWDRKNYFYPDLPKGYQISQFDKPICGVGYLDISDSDGAFEPKRVEIERAHLEEDAGKSSHDESGKGGKSKIDLNRTGTPLLEIVTRPDMRSAAEAKAFLQSLKMILTYIDVSDCNMQEGSLRCDGNINLHINVGGQTIATPIVEIKNMNSFRAAERALNYEVVRQLDEWKEAGRTIDGAPKRTFGWDDEQGVTIPQREKEESADYRYFPDPDLIAVETSDEQIDAIRQEIGTLPSQLRDDLIAQHKLGEYDADVLVNQGRAVVDYFLSVAGTCGNSKMAINWVNQEVLRHLNETNGSIDQYPVSSDGMGDLLKRINDGDLDQTRGKDVLSAMIEDSIDAGAAIEKLGIRQVDSSELDSLCQQLLDANPKVVAQVQEGKVKALGALVGQARKINPNVNPGTLQANLRKILGVDG